MTSFRRALPGSLGKTMAKKFRYCDQITLDAGIGIPATHTFVLNGLFDPDAAVGGHQPIMFDELMQFYAHYNVTGAKITATFTSTNTTATNGNAICGIEVSTSVTPTTALNDIFEQGQTVYKTLTALGGPAKVVISRKVSIKKMAGVKNLLDNQDYRGSVAANPAEKIYAHVFVSGITSGADANSVNVQIMLNQFAIMLEPLPVAGS